MMAVKKELKAKNAFVTPETLLKLAKSLNVYNHYQIEVIRDTEEAARRLRLKNHERTHSWAGSEGIKEKVRVVAFGKVEAGEDYEYEFLENGNSTGIAEDIKDGNFDINKPFGVIIDCHDWCDWNGNSGNYESNYATILIYSPESITDVNEYVKKKEAELNQICQLREATPQSQRPQSYRAIQYRKY